MSGLCNILTSGWHNLWRSGDRIAKKWGENEETEREGKWREREEMERVRGNGERMKKSQTEFTEFVENLSGSKKIARNPYN